MNAHSQKSATAAIKRIFVDRLFGEYTYDLVLDPEDYATAHSAVLLLYGENGSGKTTIAQLLFHLLSRRSGRGHRSFVGETRFAEFRVEFFNGTFIAASRDSSSTHGAYRVTARDTAGNEHIVDVKTNEEGIVKVGDVDEDAMLKLLTCCTDPPFDIYFLSDNRILQSDEFEEDIEDEFISRQGRLITRTWTDEVHSVPPSSRTRSLAVEPSIWRANMWIRRRALTASSVGEENISTIYSTLIKRFAETEPVASKQPARLAELRATLYKLAERSEEFVSLGLIPKIPLPSIIESLKSAPETQNAMLASVLEPYVDGIRARLDAMSTMQNRLSTFLEIINVFYRNKSVRINISDGIQVFDGRGAVLNPSVMSSGEKQLMLLLCNVLAASDKSSIFIIDEPELSLNIKWQRRLVDSLIQLVEGSNVQFIMATHSIELLARHKRSVMRLEAKNGEVDSL